MSLPSDIDLVELTKDALRFHAPGIIGVAHIRSHIEWVSKASPSDAEIHAAAQAVVSSGFAVSSQKGWQIASAV
jgi:hypothetical protein